MILLNVAGGVALILFGTRFLRKGLDRLFGQKLVVWLQSLAANPLKAFLAGIVSGVATPSSTAVSLVALQMVSSGRLTTERMLAVFLGAGVGITAPAQLLAFHVQEYAALFLVAGVLGFQFLKRNAFRGAGQCLMALGWMFLAMQMISSATRSISPQGDMGLLLRLLADHHWAVAFCAAIFGFALQSSTATIGLGLGLATSGLFSAPAMMAWVLGANLGIALTTLAAGWSHLEGRRLATAHLLAKGGSAVILLLVLPLLASFKPTPHELVAHTVHFHTLFNLGVGLLCLPLIRPIAALMRFLIPDPVTNTLEAPPTYLDGQALEMPSLALANANRQVMAMADEVRLMLHSFWQAQIQHDKALAGQVRAHDDHVDDSAAAVIAYLSRMNQEDLGGPESQWQFTLFSCVNELESIGDIVDKNLCDFVRKQAAHGFPMVSEDQTLLAECYEKLRLRIDVAFSLLTTRDMAQATAFIAEEEAFEDWCRQAQRAHYERLRCGGEKNLASSVYFLDMLGSFRRINSHLSTIAYAFAPDAPGSLGEEEAGVQPTATAINPAQATASTAPAVNPKLPGSMNAHPHQA